MERNPGGDLSSEDAAQKPMLLATDGDNTSQDKSPDKTLESKGLSLLQTGVILLSFSYGSAVVIVPNTLVQLGPVTSLLILLIVILMVGYCTYLNNASTKYALHQPQCLKEVHREPYPTIAELAGGPLFRKFVVFMLYLTMLTASLGYVLLSATMINNTFPIPEMGKYDSVRIWLTIIFLIMTPLVFHGTLVDMYGAAVFSVWASSVSLAAVTANCFILYYHFDVSMPPAPRNPDTVTEEMFITFGLYAFATGGPSYMIPNIVVFVKKPKNVPQVITIVFGVLSMLYLVAGTIPYSMFGNALEESVEGTFTQFNHLTHIIRILTAVCDITMSLHLLLAATLTINPLYLHIESTLDVPVRINWKRLVIRSSGMLFIYVICMAFPRFRDVLSVIGGIPITLVGVIFPIVIHSLIFENNTMTKLLHLIILLFFLTFMVGNLVCSVQDIWFNTVEEH